MGENTKINIAPTILHPYWEIASGFFPPVLNRPMTCELIGPYITILEDSNLWIRRVIIRGWCDIPGQCVRQIGNDERTRMFAEVLEFVVREVVSRGGPIAVTIRGRSGWE